VSLKNFIPIIWVMLIVSCSFSGGKIPADHYYRLAEASVEKNSVFKVNNFLLNPVKVEGLYHERSILYVEESAPLELKRYHYHYWVETPAKLVGKYVQSYLLQTGISNNVSFNVTSHPADIETDITITNFERIIAQGSVQSLISLRMSVKYSENTKQNFSKLYTAKVTADSSAMHATAEAFGKALNEIMDLFVADLSNNI